MMEKFPLNAAVRGNGNLKKALGRTRERDMTIRGRVKAYDTARRRIGVLWEGRAAVEYLPPECLDLLEN